MNLEDIYDNVGRDGEDNEKAFNRMPSILKYFITSNQSMILERVKKKVGEIYGENGLKDLVKTSGYRSFSTNIRNGGVSDSLHLYGLAIDFRKTGIFKDKPIPTCCTLETIDSGKVWHVQYRRSK